MSLTSICCVPLGAVVVAVEVKLSVWPVMLSSVASINVSLTALTEMSCIAPLVAPLVKVTPVGV